jgi:hypothetical protein
MMRLGNSMPKDSSSPKIAPEAPTVGEREPMTQVKTSCTMAALNVLATRICV